MRNIIRAISEAFLGLFLAISIIYAADSFIPAVINERAEVVDIDNNSVTMHIYGTKIRGLQLLKPVQTETFAIDYKGNRRIVQYETLGDAKPATYPRGKADFGTWKFTDPSIDPRVITQVEIVTHYQCLLRKCSKKIGPFKIES